jgi:hypothetical protein
VKAEGLLPIAATAAIAPATATATATAVTTAAAVTTATSPAPATAATESTTTTAAPAAPRLALTGFVDSEGSTVERLTVQLGNGALRIFLACELDEGEPARLACHSIGHDADADDFAPTGGACLSK